MDMDIVKQAQADAAQATCTLAEYLAANPGDDVYDYVLAIEKMIGRRYSGNKRNEYRCALIEAAKGAAG